MGRQILAHTRPATARTFSFQPATARPALILDMFSPPQPAPATIEPAPAPQVIPGANVGLKADQNKVKPLSKCWI